MGPESNELYAVQASGPVSKGISARNGNSAGATLVHQTRMARCAPATAAFGRISMPSSSAAAIHSLAFFTRTTPDGGYAHRRTCMPQCKMRAASSSDVQSASQFQSSFSVSSPASPISASPMKRCSLSGSVHSYFSSAALAQPISSLPSAGLSVS